MSIAPPGWQVARLKSLARLVTTKASGSTVKIGLEDLESWTGRLTPSGSVFEGEGIAFEPGDLLFGKLRPYLAKAWVADRHGAAVGDFLVIRPGRGVDARFLRSVLLTPQRITEISAGAYGAKMPRASWEAVRDLVLVVPDSLGQQQVIEYLDRETAGIDSFIADQEELIELLAERRAAAISQAVTRGLDPTVAMTGRGIECLGAMPENWTLTPFARAVDFREGPGIGAADFRDEGVPLLRVAGVRGRYATLDGCNFLDPDMVDHAWRKFKIELGELLVSASASMGTVSEAGPEVVGAIPYTGIIRMSPGKQVDRDFLRLFLQSTAFRAQVDRFKTGSTIQHYGPEHLRQMYIPLPDLATQVLIAVHITEVTAEIDAAISDARAAITLSRERRGALISAAVTGKIDVRGAAQPVPHP